PGGTQGRGNPTQAADLAELRRSQIDRCGLRLADLVGQPRLVRTGDERAAEPPEDAPEGDTPERRHRRGCRDTGSDDAQADQDGEAPTVRIGDDAGRDLPNEHGELE